MSSILVNAVKNGYTNDDYGNKDIDVSYNLGDGNHEVNVAGNNTNITLGSGNSTVTAMGNNMNISTGDGDDNVLFLGDNVKLDTGSGNDKLVFWGNDCEVKMGDGDDSVTTFDKVYQDIKYEKYADKWLNSLETGIHKKTTLKNSTLIDKYRKTSNHFFYTKIRTYSVYEQHYDVETIKSKYVNMKGTTIDMGTGNDTANVTVGDNSSIKNSGSSKNINKTSKYSIDESLGHKDKCEIITEKKVTRKANLLAILGLGIGGLLAVVAAPAVPVWGGALAAGVVGGCVGI